MRYIGIFPLIAVVIAVYNIIAFASGGSSVAAGADPVREQLIAAVASIPMPSHESLVLTVGDLFVVFGLATLLQEILRATHVNSVELINHGLSFGVFVIALIEFLLLKGFATATFFLLLLMTLIDIFAGFVISLTAARREVEVTKE